MIRSIKITFEHPNYLYPFRLQLAPRQTPQELERISPTITQSEMVKLKEEILLTPEEDKVMSSLSLGTSSSPSL